MADLFDPSPQRPIKSVSAFRTISEVAEDLAVPQHVLRFWETKFSQIRPMKRGGGRRYYRPEDVALLRRIRQCLYEDGYTIKGVQRLLRDGSLKSRKADAELSAEPAERKIRTPLAQPSAQATDTAKTDEDSDVRTLRTVLDTLRAELGALRDLLRKA